MTHPSRLIRRASLLAALLASSWAQALTITPYSPAALDKLQHAGEPVALHFHADWCPTCRAQDKVLESLQTDPALPVAVLTVDYDQETALRKQLGIRSQSTLVVYRGTRETARSIGQTAPQALRETLRSAL